MDALLRAIATHKPDALICLGDILFGAGDQDGSYCAKAFHELSISVLAVRGNCDYREDGDYLGFELPLARALTRGNHEIHLSHRPIHLAFPAGDFVFSGHTHVKSLYKERGVVYLNPGSIALPRDDGASYAVMDEQKIVLYDAVDGETIKILSL